MSCVAGCGAVPAVAESFVDGIAVGSVYVEVSYKAERRELYVQQRAQAGESSRDCSRACEVVARQMLVGFVCVVVGG